MFLFNWKKPLWIKGGLNLGPFHLETPLLPSELPYFAVTKIVTKIVNKKLPFENMGLCLEMIKKSFFNPKREKINRSQLPFAKKAVFLGFLFSIRPPLGLLPVLGLLEAVHDSYT